MLGCVHGLIDPAQQTVSTFIALPSGHTKTGRHHPDAAYRLATQGLPEGVGQSHGLLLISIWAEHNELLSDPVCLNHVIEQIHPVLGNKILSVWEFPEQQANLPGEVQNLDRYSAQLDYVDIVQIARSLCDNKGRERPVSALPAYRHLAVPATGLFSEDDLLDARLMFR